MKDDSITIIDTSHWDAVLDFDVIMSKIKDGTLDGLYMKATDGVNYVDKQFARSSAEAMRLGIPWGAYHWLKPQVDPRRQARDYVKSVANFNPITGKWVLKFPLDPVVDVEERPIYITPAQVRTALLAFIQEFVILTGLPAERLGIYTAEWWWQPKNITPSPDVARVHWLWVANYTEADKPLMPKDWLDVGKTWRMWQYSADKNGRGKEFGGKSSSMDINRYQGGIEKFKADYPNLSVVVVPPPVVPPAVVSITAPVLTTQASLRVRDNIIPSAIRGPVPGASYSTSTTWFSLSPNIKVEALEEIKDGTNTWVRIGQRQYAAKEYDGQTFLK